MKHQTVQSLKKGKTQTKNTFHVLSNPVYCTHKLKCLVYLIHAYTMNSYTMYSVKNRARSFLPVPCGLSHFAPHMLQSLWSWLFDQNYACELQLGLREIATVNYHTFSECLPQVRLCTRHQSHIHNEKYNFSL